MRFRWVLFACTFLAVGTPAHADGIQTRGEMFFPVPFQNGGWDQKSVGPVKRARDSKDAPTLTIYVIDVSGVGTPGEIEAELPRHLRQDGVEVGGAKITSAVFGKGKDEELAVKVGYGSDAKPGTLTLRTSAATLNGKPALVAIARFEKETNLLVGIPESDAAKPLFDKIVRGVKIARRAKYVPAPPEVAPLRSIAVVKDVTASSTKGKHDAWQAIAYPADRPRDLRRGWCAGTGASLTVSFVRPTTLKSIEVGSKRVTAVNLGLDGAAEVTSRLTDGWTDLDTPKEVTTVKVSIGAGGDGCLIVRFRDAGGMDMTPIRGFDAAALDELPRAIGAIQAALFDDGRPKLQALVAFPLSVRTSEERRAIAHKDWTSIKKVCAGEGTDPRCPQTATSSTAYGAFIEPEVRAPGTVELVFPAESFRATSQDVWRLTWDGSAWKLVAIDWLAREAGQEGSE